MAKLKFKVGQFLKRKRQNFTEWALVLKADEKYTLLVRCVRSNGDALNWKKYEWSSDVDKKWIETEFHLT